MGKGTVSDYGAQLWTNLMAQGFKAHGLETPFFHQDMKQRAGRDILPITAMDLILSNGVQQCHQLEVCTQLPIKETLS